MERKTQIISIIQNARQNAWRFAWPDFCHKTFWAERPRLLQGLAITALVLFFGMLSVTYELVSTYTHYAALIETRLNNETFYQPGGIYAAPRQLSQGQPLSAAQVSEYLLRASYQASYQGEQANNEFGSGTFLSQANEIAIRTNQFARSADLPALIQLKFNAAGIQELKDGTTGQTLKMIALPAEMLTADSNLKQQSRRSARYDELPEVLIKALCAIEDRRFFKHAGVDFLAIARAGWRNLRHGSIREGGSTLTQQLAKNQFLTPARTWERKLTEAMMALALERRLSKQEILALYCNRVYLGQSGLTAVFGFAQGAQTFLGKELKDVTFSEAAFLVGLVKAPNRYAPYNHFEAAIARRNVVLRAMLDAGTLNASEFNTSQAETVALAAPKKLEATAAPHFVDYVSRELARQQSDEIDWTQTRVETTLDLDLQQVASQAVNEQLKRLTKLLGKRAKRAAPQIAFVALNPQTGEVLALVGGNDYALSQLNRVTDARRQPGSVFKPVVYAAALSHGIAPTTTFMNARHKINYGYQAVYRPENFGRSYSNTPVTMRESLVRSLNVVTVEAALETGLSNVANMAQRLGLPRPDLYPSMALGAFEATPLEVAEAYTAFANAGKKTKPQAIRTIKVNNQTLIDNEPEKTTVLDPALAYLITDALADVVNRGTATRVRQAGFRGPAAGKTGTSRDAWFVGYTPRLLAVVWVGYDDNSDLNLTGGEAAAPLWADFMKRALTLRPALAAKQFTRPAGLEIAEVCAATGALANPYCPERQKLLVTSALLPGECTTHQALPLFEAAWSEIEVTSAPVFRPLYTSLTPGNVTTSAQPKE